MNWTRNKPTEPGAYFVRGFALGHPLVQALVEVRKWRGVLICNLHETTGDCEYDDWPHMTDMSQNFSWCGPLATVKPALTNDERDLLRAATGFCKGEFGRCDPVRMDAAVDLILRIAVIDA